MRVLVVEDNDAVRVMLQNILTDEGHAVALSDGRDPIVALVVEQQPDAIILDLGLPVVSGEVLLENLWQDERTRAIPVILSSAWRGRMIDAHRAAEGRRPLFLLPKPFTLDELFEVLDQATLYTR